MLSLLRGSLSILGFLALWEIAARSGLVPTDYFPAPLLVGETLVAEIGRGEIVSAFVATFLRALIGATAASLLAIAMALLAARYAIVRRAFDPIAEFLRPLPPAALVPLAIFFLGLGWKLYGFILVFACFWPVYLNAAQALAATPQPRIAIRTWTEPAHVAIAVSDNGPGVPHQARSRLFDPFFTTKDVGQGSGLGLFISQAVVTRRGGRIDFDASHGGGACFVIRLPRVDVARVRAS